MSVPRWLYDPGASYGKELPKLTKMFNALDANSKAKLKRHLLERQKHLKSKNLLDEYMKKLTEQFNPKAVSAVMCKSTLSIDWQGYMYDCDFNQMLGLRVDHGMPVHISEFDNEKLNQREIVTKVHCFGCTAGNGSSCGGEVV